MVSDDSRETTSNSSEVPVPKRTRLLLRFVFVGIVLVFGLALSEIALRLVAPQPPSWLDVYRQHPVLKTYTLQPDVERLIDTGECRWTVRSDKDGYRVSKIDSTSGPVVLCLGDSYAFGYGVDHEQTYTGLLQKKFAGSLRLINAAVPGYGPVQYEQVLDYSLQQGIKPVCVIIGTYVGNDIHDSVWQKNVAVRNGVLGNRGDARSLVKMNSHLYRLFSKVYHRVSIGDDEAFQFQEAMSKAENWNSGILQKAERAYADRFSAIASRCRENSIPLLVMIIPPRISVASTSTISGDLNHDGADLPVLHAARIMTDLQIPFIELTSQLVGQPLNEIYFRHDGHFTPRGHQYAMEALLKRLTDMNLLPP